MEPVLSRMDGWMDGWKGRVCFFCVGVGAGVVVGEQCCFVLF